MRSLLITLSLVAASSAYAQHADHQRQAQPSGYAGMQSRDIKALSAEQVTDLREGRGMGASLPAELNGVPGPMHVLQLAQQLKVTPEQRQALEGIAGEMKARAQSLGAQVVAEEAALDNAFKGRSIDVKSVEEATARIASFQGQLRAVHLVAHLKTRELLSDEQVAVYNSARGYTTADGHQHRH
jgi:Spy/CpxP family protein refolding chaperone